MSCVLYPTLLSRGACGLGQEEPSRAMRVERTTYMKRQTFHGLEGPQQSRPWSGPTVHPPSWRFFSHHADPEFSFGSAVHQCPVNVSSSFFLLETVYFPSTYLHLKSLWRLPHPPPSGPVTKTLCSQCRGPGFDLWLGN